MAEERGCIRAAGVAIAMLVGLVVLPGRLAAQDAVSQEDQRARVHFQSGAAYFETGEYENALRDFERAYELSGRATLLYNIGLTHERLGNYGQAARFLRQYVDEVRPTDSATLEVRIRNLEQRAQSQHEGAPRAVADDATRSDGPGALPWVLVGSGAVATAAGVVLLLMAQSAIDEVESPPMDAYWTDVEGSADRAPLLSGLGFAALGAGVVTAGIGVVLLASGGGEDDGGEVAIVPTGSGVLGRVRF